MPAGLLGRHATGKAAVGTSYRRVDDFWNVTQQERVICRNVIKQQGRETTTETPYNGEDRPPRSHGTEMGDYWGVMQQGSDFWNDNQQTAGTANAFDTPLRKEV